MSSRRLLPAAAFALLAVPMAVACGNSTVTSAPPPPPPPTRAPVASASASGLPPELKAPEYVENDFVESDRNRDPFRSFLVQHPTAPEPQNQRKVELAQYSIDELKLIAIVQGSDQPRAMFTDPSGKGTVVYKGTYICRPEVVHVGGTNGPEYQLNWRVDRIRDTDVVLIRYDPTNGAIPPATRVVPLHPEAEKEQTGVPG